MYGRATVGDEDLLPVDEVPAVLQRDAGADGAEIRARLGLGEVHGALQIPRGERRQIAELQLFGAEALNVLRYAGLQADDRHQASVGSRHHLEVEAIEQEREALTAVSWLQRRTDQARTAKLLVTFGNVRRDHDGALFEAHL